MFTQACYQSWTRLLFSWPGGGGVFLTAVLLVARPWHSRCGISLAGILTWYCLDVYGTAKQLIYTVQRQCFFCFPTTEMSTVLLTARKCYRVVCFICLIYYSLYQEPFKCYVMQWGYMDQHRSAFRRCMLQYYYRYEGVGCPISRKNRYVTLEWPLSSCHLPFLHS